MGYHYILWDITANEHIDLGKTWGDDHFQMPWPVVHKFLFERQGHTFKFQNDGDCEYEDSVEVDSWHKHLPGGG